MEIRTPCSTLYYPAYHKSGKRDLNAIHWIVLHDEEAPTALAAARYFKLASSGGSAHLCVDDNACYRCLSNNDIPWAARSAEAIGANTHGFHIEMAGYASWTLGQWLLKKKTIERAAWKTAIHCKLFNLPMVWVSADELVAGARLGHPVKGITSHKAITYASKKLDPNNAWKYDHTDPGIFFPRRYFISLVKQYKAEL